MFEPDLLQYPSLTGPVAVPAAAEAPQTTDRWQPRFADRVYPKSGLHASNQTFQFYPVVSPPRAEVPGSGFTSTGAIPFIQYQAITGPFFFLPPPFEDLRVFTSYPDKVYPNVRVHVSRQPFTWQDKFTAPTPAVVPDYSWRSYHADLINPRLGQHASRQLAYASDRAEAPAGPPAPFASWHPTYIDRHKYNRPLAPYVKGHEEFSVIVRVPVMSWTGLYLDPPVRRKSHRALFASGSPHLLVHSLVADLAPANSWGPRYPARIDPRLRSLAALEAKSVHPIFIPDVTVGIPPLSWSGRYDDRVLAARRLQAGSQPAFFFDRFDAPDEVIAPDMAVAIFVDRVLGRPRATELNYYTQPIYITDVTEPVPFDSWLPVAPDYIIRLDYPVSEQLAWTSPHFVPDVTQPVPGISWQGNYPNYIWRRPLLLPGSNPSFTTDAKWDAPPFVIGINIQGTVYIVRSLGEDVFVVRTLSEDVEL